MNSSKNLSNEIAKRPMINFVNGLIFACVRGTPPTRFCSLNVRGAPKAPQKINTAYLKRAGEFLRYNGVEPVYMWTIEHPFGGPLNIHSLIHVPANLMEAFVEREEQWAVKAGLPERRDSPKGTQPFHAIQLRGLMGTTGFFQSVEGTAAYLLKGGNPEACSGLGIAHDNQGKVYGQRCGLAQSIDRTARARAGFQDKLFGSADLQFPWRFEFKP
jgi:hypothetical protein